MKQILSSCMVLLALHVRAQLFTQNFESSTVLSDYYNTAPDANQFNSIKANGSTSVSINAGSLSFSRAGDSGCGFSRSTNFNPAPQIIQYKFDIEVSGNAAAQTTAAVMQVGSGFGTGVSIAESNADTHSKFSVNFDTVSGRFSLKDNTSGGSTSSVYNGRQTITWIINNSDSPFSYTGPDGSTETAAADTWDLWIGINKELNDRDAITTTQELKNFKFVFTAGTGTIDIDNITISDFTVLPIELVSFKSEIKNGSALLRWTTASEKNSSYFNIYRSEDGKKFDQTAAITAAGNSTGMLQYSYRDEGLRSGTTYYRLEQEDFDGKKIILGLASVNNEAPLQLKLLSLNPQEAQFSIYSPKAVPAELILKNISGQSLARLNLKLQEGYNQAAIPLKGKCRGLYIASLQTQAEIVSQKLLW